jgi:hypothetical protein
MRYSLDRRGRSRRYAWTLLAATAAACSPDDPTSPRAPDEPVAGGAVRASADLADALPVRLSNRFAYVFANQPTSASYAPSTAYAYNATGGAIQITRGGAGTYIVTFASPTGWTSSKLGFAITAYGSSTLDCQMRNSLMAGTNLSVYVFCFDRATLAARDSYFTLLVVGSGSLLQRSAFAWADQTVAPSYTPNPLSSYTSGPGAIQVTHGALAGDYTVDLGTGNTQRSTVLVNAVASTRDLCKVGEWHITSVRVRCFDAGGAPSNRYYWVLQVDGGRTGRRLGFAFANQPTAASYTPNVNYSRNSSGGAVKATRWDTGRYAIEFAGLQKLPGHTETVQVTPWGSGPALCKVVGWGNFGAGLRIDVQCRKLDGAFVDSRYNVLVIE